MRNAYSIRSAIQDLLTGRRQALATIAPRAAAKPVGVCYDSSLEVLSENHAVEGIIRLCSAIQPSFVSAYHL